MSQELEDSHGSIQLEQILKDRPAMGAYFDESGGKKTINLNDEPWHEMAKMFKTPENELYSIWDNSPMPKGDEFSEYRAMHTYAKPGTPSKIIVRKTKLNEAGKEEAIGFEEFWSLVAFELVNFSNAEDFNDLLLKASEGLLSKEEWVVRNARLEFQSLISLRKFYEKSWKPWAEKNNYRGEKDLWGISGDVAFEVWFREVRKNGSYRIWDVYYEELVKP